jgi:enamine deaminase RidA (YjgF/YER057c/UK114 family)
MSDIQLIKGSDALPFSAATIHNEVVYVSGQVGFKPNTMELVSDEVGEQADQTFANIDAILEEAGTSRDRIMRVCVYLVHCQRDFGRSSAREVHDRRGTGGAGHPHRSGLRRRAAVIPI